MFNLCALDIQWFQVLLYGGQVVSWKNERREELLFVSSKVKQKKAFFKRVCFQIQLSRDLRTDVIILIS